MFFLSFVLEDWAIQELVEKPRHRTIAILLVASSYVTWTYQTHTFSNSIETILVSWSLVLIQRIVGDKVNAISVEDVTVTNRHTAANVSFCVRDTGFPGCLWVL